LADAEREWLEAVRIKPTFGEAHNNLAAMYLMTGRPQEAEKSAQAGRGVWVPRPVRPEGRHREGVETEVKRKDPQ
jgi:hypothetical protein